MSRSLWILMLMLVMACFACDERDNEEEPTPDQSHIEDFDEGDATNVDGESQDQSQDLSADAQPSCAAGAVYHPGISSCVVTEGVGADCADLALVCQAACNDGQECMTYPTAMGDFCSCGIPCGPEPELVCPEGYQCDWAGDTPKSCTSIE